MKYQFAAPYYWYLFIIIALIAALTVATIILKRKLLNKIIDVNSQKSVLGNKSFPLEIIKAVLIVLALVSLAVGLMNLQFGSKTEKVKQEGIDIMVCLDVSSSMNADDLKPTRLMYAKMQIKDLMKKFKGNHVGLIVFAYDAFVQFPLTLDYSAAELFLNATDTRSVPQQGTSLSTALDLAVKSFDPRSKTKKVIILITDGEDHEGAIDDALSKAKENDIKIFTIGIGNPDGTPIPVLDERGNKIGSLTDDQGNVVMSHLDDTILKQIADNTGGKFFIASPSSLEITSLQNEINGMQKTTFGELRVVEYEDQFQWFIAFAILLLVIEQLLTDRKMRSVQSLMKYLKLTEE